MMMTPTMIAKICSISTRSMHRMRNVVTFIPGMTLSLRACVLRRGMIIIIIMRAGCWCCSCVYAFSIILSGCILATSRTHVRLLHVHIIGRRM